MQKRARRKNNRSTLHRNRVGALTGLLAADGTEISVGDYVRLRGTEYDGPVLYHRTNACFGICFGLWYGDDVYDYSSYGKFVEVPLDQSLRMELLRISQCDALYDAAELQTCRLRGMAQ